MRPYKRNDERRELVREISDLDPRAVLAGASLASQERRGLVLSRRVGERIILSTESAAASVEVADIVGDRVRLRIVAPGQDVHREEVYRRIHDVIEPKAMTA